MAEDVARWQERRREIPENTDSNWGGCKIPERSNTGVARIVGSCLIGHWSRTLVGVTLSSADANKHASVKAACEDFGSGTNV